MEFLEREILGSGYLLEKPFQLPEVVETDTTSFLAHIGGQQNFPDTHIHPAANIFHCSGKVACKSLRKKNSI